MVYVGFVGIHTLINCNGLHGVIYVFPLLSHSTVCLCEIVWVLSLLIIRCIGLGGGGGGGAFFFAAQLVAFHPETLYVCDIFAQWLVTVLNTTHTQQSSAFVCFHLQNCTMCLLHFHLWRL